MVELKNTLLIYDVRIREQNVSTCQFRVNVFLRQLLLTTIKNNRDTPHLL